MRRFIAWAFLGLCAVYSATMIALALFHRFS